MIEAARNGDFQTAKELFDAKVAEGAVPLELLNSTDRRMRTVAHYAAQYDEVVVMEWLHARGANLFVRDDANKSPIEISVLLDAKIRRKKRGEGSEVLEFLKRVVLNPIQQMFYLESGESTKSVSDSINLEHLTDEQLVESFPFHNNLQAVHLFAMDNRLDLLKYMYCQRHTPMTAVDDDCNTVLHFVSSEEAATFLIEDCKLNPDAHNSSDGYTPCHALIERIANGDVSEESGVAILREFIRLNANFSIPAHSDNMGVAELALDLLGMGAVFSACLESPTALNGKSLSQYLAENPQDAPSESDLSIASHDDKVIAENSDESEGEEGEDSAQFLENCIPPGEDSPENGDDFFIRRG